MYKLLLLTFCFSFSAFSYDEKLNIRFAQVDGHELKLDLYLPKHVEQPQLLVWIHGGAWRKGDKIGVRKKVMGLLNRGYAIASVNYRLSPVARFPAQIHDLKGAIRFLRSQQAKFGYNAEKIVVAGSSAGGHLTVLVGVTNGHEALEGSVGGNLNVSSDVQAIVDFYGPTNFMTILKQSTPHGLSVRAPALKLLLGDLPEKQKTLAKLASPVFHVDKSDPPLLLIHGDMDPQVPINQSLELHGQYKKYGLQCKFIVVHGGAHGGKGFYENDKLDVVDKFIKKSLK